MKQSLTRMQFLTGNFRGHRQVLRPPWIIDEAHFLKLCTSCGDCIQSCPTSILVKGRAGLPIVDFNRGECEFCGECVESCKTGALNNTAESGAPPWSLKAAIDDTCIAYQGVVCRSCAEQCQPRAIVFQLSAGQVPQPSFNQPTCNGCGACVSICPVNAISVYEPSLASVAT